MTVAAIIPVWNEESAIGDVIRELVSTGIPDEIVVVDSASSDRTVEVAKAAGARVVVEKRRGYGRACATGVLSTTAGVLVFLDGDGADNPTELPLLLEPVQSGKADLALGTRNDMERGALPFHARLGNSLAARLISLAWSQHVTDLPSFKVIRREDLLRLNMSEATYGWTIEMIVKAARQGYRLCDIPVRYRRRNGGESKVSGNLQTSVRAAASILSTLARHGWGSNPGPTLLPNDHGL